MKNDYLYVGSWLDDTGKSGGGIHIYRRKTAGGELEKLDVCREDLAAGYICVSPDKKYLYAVNEIKRKPDCVNTDGSIYSFQIEPDGRLRELNHISSCGVFPNYLAVSSDGKALFAVNYGSEDMVIRSGRDENGNFVLKHCYEESSMISVSVNDDGSLGKIRDLKVFDGIPSRFFAWFQSAPHPHCIGLDPTDRMLLVTDRGCEEVVTCNWDKENGTFRNFHKYKTDIGVGPRNCIFHPDLPYVYVVGEVQPYVICYRYHAKTAVLEKTAQYLTASEENIYIEGKEFFDCAHPSDIKIHPNGKILYVANRGPDTIACFEISEEDGTLTHIQDVASEGIMPWSLAITADGRNMYVGNKVSDCMTVFALDERGIPIYVDKLAVPRTVCLKSLQLEDGE